MLQVPFGEKSPRVVALQVLLNRSSAVQPKLVTDGAYGKLTQAAVDTFRSKVMSVSGPPGEAEPALWRFLLERERLQVIDSVDVTDPVLLDIVVPEVSKWNDPIVIGGMSNGIAQLVTEVRARAQGDNSILLLRLHGHGSPGLIALSHGSRRVSPGIDPILAQSIINSALLPVVSPLLQQITPLMHNLGFIEFHSCRVAEGGGGINFVTRLANIVRVPVRAAQSKQPAETVFTLVGSTFNGMPEGQSLEDWGFSRQGGVRPFAGPIAPPPEEFRNSPRPLLSEG
jgi:peptidoglycan hydrolase-like protein with peptidoglycan-binding domain